MLKVIGIIFILLSGYWVSHVTAFKAFLSDTVCNSLNECEAESNKIVNGDGSPRVLEMVTMHSRLYYCSVGSDLSGLTDWIADFRISGNNEPFLTINNKKDASLTSFCKYFRYVEALTYFNLANDVILDLDMQIDNLNSGSSARVRYMPNLGAPPTSHPTSRPTNKPTAKPIEVSGIELVNDKSDSPLDFRISPNYCLDSQCLYYPRSGVFDSMGKNDYIRVSVFVDPSMQSKEEFCNERLNAPISIVVLSPDGTEELASSSGECGRFFMGLRVGAHLWLPWSHRWVYNAPVSFIVRVSVGDEIEREQYLIITNQLKPSVDKLTVLPGISTNDAITNNYCNNPPIKYSETNNVIIVEANEMGDKWDLTTCLHNSFVGAFEGMNQRLDLYVNGVLKESDSNGFVNTRVSDIFVYSADSWRMFGYRNPTNYMDKRINVFAGEEYTIKLVAELKYNGIEEANIIEQTFILKVV